MVDSFQFEDGEGLHALDENQQARRGDGYGVVDPGSGACKVTAKNQTLGQTDTLAVAAGDVLVNGTKYSVSQQDVGLDAANPSDPRRDVVYVDNNGNVQVAKGTPEAPDPSGQNLSRFEFFRPAPADLSGTVGAVLAEVWVPAGASSVDSADIRDRRLRALGPHSLDEDITTQSELNTHAGNASVHHTAFTPADHDGRDHQDALDATFSPSSGDHIFYNGSSWGTEAPPSGGGGGAYDASPNSPVAPGNVQSEIDSVTNDDAGRVTVVLQNDTTYDFGTLNVKEGVDLVFNGAKVVATSDTDIIHCEPGSRVFWPDIDVSGVTFSSAAIVLDALLYGRYDEETDSEQFGSVDIIGGRFHGVETEGTVFRFKADNNTGIGGDNLYNPRVKTFRTDESGIAFELISGDQAFVNSVHVEDVYIQHPEVGVKLTGTVNGNGSINNLTFYNSQIQTGANSTHGILQENGSGNHYRLTKWDPDGFTTAAWELTSDADGENRLTTDWRLTDADFIDNSGADTNRVVSTIRDVAPFEADGRQSVKFYNSNDVQKNVLEQRSKGGDLFIKSAGGGGELQIKPDGRMLFDFGSYIIGNNGLRTKGGSGGTYNNAIVEFGTSGARIELNGSGELVAIDDAGNETTLT